MTSAARIVGVKNPGTPSRPYRFVSRPIAADEDDLYDEIAFPGRRKICTQCFQQAVKVRKTGQKTGPGLGAYTMCESFQISWSLR